MDLFEIVPQNVAGLVQDLEVILNLIKFFSYVKIELHSKFRVYQYLFLLFRVRPLWSYPAAPSEAFYSQVLSNILALGN